ncbi:ArsR/SmtB family transcription factor [Lysobacter koreensis]|uniref:ArsR/SmtB family transcription factor n=1 Tax=Lysobacter koreensis TaxID=266122 RepID=A0ABW2YHW4_9GAMM
MIRAGIKCNRMVEQSARLDHIFGALADPTRRAMLRSLSTRELNVGELAAPYRMSLAAASKHVKVLERAGLVRRTVLGRTHLCSIEPAALAQADQWLRFYERFWTDRLDALDAALQAEDRSAAVKPGKARRK